METKGDIILSSTGLITSAGIDLQENMENMSQGVNSIRKVNRWDTTGIQTENFGEIYLSNEELYNTLEKEVISHRKFPMERGELLIFKALEEALKKIDLSPEELKSERVSVVIGTSLCGFTNLELEYNNHKVNGSKINSRSFMTYPLNVVVDRICYEYGIKGKRYLFSTACSASLHAVYWAGHLLDNDEADLVIAGGTDPLSMMSMAGFSSLRSLAKNSCSPFSSTDPGISVGEGAGIIILECEERRISKKKNATEVYLSGFSGNSDAYHPTASDPLGISIKKSIEDVLNGIEDPSSKNCLLVTHGTGTIHNDQVETRAIKQVKGLGQNVKVTSIKSMIGHTLGASGIIELVLLAKSIENEIALPTINFSENRIGCDLDYVKNKILNYKADFGIKSAFAFGGNNVAVSVTRGKEINKRQKIEYDNDSIAITGIGCINGYSTNQTEMNKLIASGISSIKQIEPVYGLNSSRSSKKAAIVNNDYINELSELLKIKNIRKMDRISKLAVIAAVQASQNSGIKITSANAYKIGMISGTGSGPLNSVNEFYDVIINKGVEFADAGLYPNVVVNAHAGYINMELKIKGYSTVITHGSISGMCSIDLAVRLIRSGVCEAVLVGSTSEYCKSNHRALIDINSIDDNSKAYNQNSRGIVFGEGSTFFVIEKLSNAINRKAKVHGIIEQVELKSAPVMPSTYGFSKNENPLNSVLEKFKTNNINVDIILGEGTGIYSAAQHEIDAVKRFYPESPLKSYTDFFGHVSGVSTFNNIMQFCLNKPGLGLSNYTVPSTCLVTCLSEGGMAGALILKDYLS